MSESGGLTRRTESLLRALRTRHGRRDSEHCFCDGLRASREVVTLAPDLVELVILREDISLPFPSPVEPVVLPRSEFDRIAPTVHSQGILVLSRRPAPVPMDAPMADPFALVLDRATSAPSCARPAQSDCMRSGSRAALPTRSRTRWSVRRPARSSP